MLLRVCVWACTKARVESQTAPTGCSLTQTFLAASFFFFFFLSRSEMTSTTSQSDEDP